MGSEAGHWACVPVQSASFSHVAKLAERHLAPADMKLQPGTGKWIIVNLLFYESKWLHVFL